MILLYAGMESDMETEATDETTEKVSTGAQYPYPTYGELLANMHIALLDKIINTDEEDKTAGLFFTN